MNEVFDKFVFDFYYKESIILNKNELKSKYIIVPIEGKLVNSNDNSIICKRSDLLFGEDIYLNNQSLVDFDIKCTKYSFIAKCKTEDILNNLNFSFIEYAEKYSVIEQLKNVPIFKNFTETKFEDILHKIKTEKIEKNNNLITEGEEEINFI